MPTPDAARWSYNDGATINSDAVNEPSATLSLNLSATGAGPLADHEIRSNFILLGGSSDLELSYYTQHRGVGIGEELVVEYWIGNLQWIEINRVTSDGLDQQGFDFHTHLLPQDAYHNEFRSRFRTEVDDSTDDWYIDDVMMTGCGCPADMNNDGWRNGDDMSAFIHCLISTGSNCGCADLDAGGVLDTRDLAMFVSELLAGTPCP